MLEFNRVRGRGDVVFATILKRSSMMSSFLLIESICSFAESFSQNPILCFLPSNESLLESEIKMLEELGVNLITFSIDPHFREFPFIPEAVAASMAETTVERVDGILAWMNANTVILGEPEAFTLEDDKYLGYRPVHHTNIGSSWDQPIDPFWSTIYRLCNVSEDHLHPMKTHVDGNYIRPYYNAGFHASRPERKLLGSWRRKFLELHETSSLQELYKQNSIYRIFVHQAILSGIILAKLEPEEMQELPPSYNYPLHLFHEDVSPHRPSRIEEMVTIRHEGFYKNPGWMEKFPAGEQLKQWIHEKLEKYQAENIF
ncbi:MAG: hypothetical protein ACLFVP_00145 [Candidatus Bathyarchaeia archaeon]